MITSKHPRKGPPPIPAAARQHKPTPAEIAERKAELDTRTHRCYSDEGLSLAEREALERGKRGQT